MLDLETPMAHQRFLWHRKVQIQNLNLFEHFLFAKNVQWLVD